jgi:glutamate/tyrosine decarboxylase-like PLP-dependent enzyme
MTNEAGSFDLSPDELRRLGHETVEIMLEAIASERVDPVYRKPSGAELMNLFNEPLPEEGCGPDEVIQQWRTDVLPYCRRNGHPRFFAYVCTSADPVGMLADAVASALNQPVTAWRSSPATTTVERQVLQWLDELTGFSAGGSGAMTSGGSMANFQSLACAVHGAELRSGLPSGSRHRMVIYLSTEGHVSLKKAARVLGIPDDQVRLIGIDRNRRMRVEDLRRQIQTDRRLGLVPVAVCASAGTANTGAIDPLRELGSLCRTEEIWFHVDGSYGAPAVLTEEFAWMKEGFQEADSLSLDPHKWLFAPVDAGCMLVREDEILRSAFSIDSEYTTVVETDPIERFAYFDRGLEMSRRFRALKVWSILKARGVANIRRVVQHNIKLRYRLDELIDAREQLEPLGSELSISCFRYVPGRETDLSRADHINETIVNRLVEDGRFYLSPTVLDGKYSLRVCIVNFRTTEQDIIDLVDEIVLIGDSIE